MEENVLHPQVSLRTSSHDIEVDEKLADVIHRIDKLDIAPTTGSCQNYGEYLRSLGLNHVHESLRDYAYLEFETFSEATFFLGYVFRRTQVNDMMHHQIAQNGTPMAWDTRYIFDRHKTWVMFPETDIEELSRILSL